MEQLSGQDAMFLHAELDGLPQHIGGVSIYDQSTAEGGTVRFKQILKMLDSRVHLSPIFRRKLAVVPMGLGRPYWVEDPDFDLEYHVRHIALPKPGDWRQLCILAARLHSQPLQRDRPLWEMYVIEGLNNVEGIPKKSFALLLKVHHCAMDGATGALFMNIVHDLTPEISQPEAAPPWIVERPSNLRMLGRAYVDAWKKPGQIVNMLQQGGSAFNRIRQGKKHHDFHTLDAKQRTRFQGKISRHRVVEGRKFDFEVIRAIKNTLPGVTVNDVMLTIVAGGLRKYLQSKNELPEQTLVTGCPIDVRSVEEKSAGGNMVGFMNVGLRTDIEDPVERLKAVHQEALSAKSYAQALGPRLMVDLTDVMPGNVLSLAIRAASTTGLAEASVIQNTIVTNVPGAPFQLYMCGALLVDSFSLGPLLPNVGLFHIVYSAVQNKKGSITLSITACRDMMPDPGFYADCLQASFDELHDAALGKKKRGRRKKTK
ncbi:MAG: wax ester/triacylglycerol synthase family O-acyltransferase [Halieaceae bacterium]|nr:wax ester/triacylglycerol synthase family O-acyltransferase [Halieaceae bacterium]